MKRRTFFKLLSWGAFFGGIGYVRADSKNISSHSEGELFPHEEGVDTTGSEDASAALSKLVLSAGVYDVVPLMFFYLRIVLFFLI